MAVEHVRELLAADGESLRGLGHANTNGH
jgi:hypothetical protein